MTSKVRTNSEACNAISLKFSPYMAPNFGDLYLSMHHDVRAIAYDMRTTVNESDPLDGNVGLRWQIGFVEHGWRG